MITILLVVAVWFFLLVSAWALVSISKDDFPAPPNNNE